MRPTFSLGSKATEQTLLLVAAAFRVAAAIELLTWLPVDLEPRWATPVLMAVLVAESALLFFFYARRGAIGPKAVVVGDLLFVIAVMAVDLMLTGDVTSHEWGHWIRNFAMSSLVGICIGLRTWRATLLAVGVMCGAYWACMGAVGAHDEFPFYRTMNFFVDGFGGWAVAAFVRPRAALMDAAHVRAVESDAALARELDRSARAALLHDRILQTLEVLTTREAVPDNELRRQVAASANWLRSYVQDEHTPGPHDLRAALREAISDVEVLHDLKVDLQYGQLRTAEIPPRQEMVTAVAGSVREALTNVAKHAGVRHAVVTCEIDDGDLLVSVVDHGRGFHVADQPDGNGTGLVRSVRQRIEDAGGRVLIFSSPGSGAQVEIRVPLLTPPA